MRSLKQDADPTATSYAAAMEVCNKRDLAKVALGIFDLMLERGVGHDQHLIDRRTSVGFFKLVVHNLGDERLRLDGLRLLDAIRAHGLSPAVGAQDYLIVAWRSKLPEHVVKYFVKMREEGIILSWTAIRCVMSFYQWSDPAFTLTLYGELTERGVRPDRVHFNAALTAYCELDRMDQAMQLLKDGPSLQVEPNAQTYQIVIRSCTSKGNNEEALALFEAMREGQISPYRATYHDLVLCYVRLKRYADAATLCNGMAPGSQRPGEDACSFLRRTCQRYDWTDAAAHVAEDFPNVRRAPGPGARRP
jgi:pentatricopeptide repeat protein